MLLAVPCDTFVYNRSFQLATFDGALRPVMVPAFDASTSSVVDRDVVLGVGVEPATDGAFSVASLGRGLGGCGDAATYRFDGQAVVLVEARAYECQEDQPPIVDPNDWPVVYRAP